MTEEKDSEIVDELVLSSNSLNRNVHLGNSDSEFTLVQDKSKISNEFGLHCISTIDALNERIANLSNTLGETSVFNHELFDDDDSDDEQKETKKGIVESKIGLSIHRKSIQPGIKKADRNIVSKPLLVELHSFPGFNEDLLTPLPSHLDALFILEVVTKARIDLQRKPTFKKIFMEFFHSINSQVILQDSFWWYFCHKYQPAADPQEKLFDRIAKNYTNLLVTWTGSKYQDKLFKDYADLMSQAVYSTFCHSFPTSYRQFNADFRDDVLSLINLWMMGTKPALRSWEKWNFESIEPYGLRKGRILKDDADKGSLIEMDLERINFQPSKMIPGNSLHQFDQVVAKETLNHSKSVTPSSILLKTSSCLTSHSNLPKHAKFADVIIAASEKEKEKGLKKVKKKDSMENMMQQISSVLGIVEKAEKKHSCAAGEGPKFQKVVFNLYGCSPLVEHFLQSHNLLKDAGTSVLVQRTEIASLPPLCAETYQDVIDSVKGNSKKALKKYKEVSLSQQKKLHELVHKHKIESYNFSRCSEKLLSNPQEVRKLSELLRMTDGSAFDLDETASLDDRVNRLKPLLQRHCNEKVHQVLAIRDEEDKLKRICGKVTRCILFTPRD